MTSIDIKIGRVDNTAIRTESPEQGKTRKETTDNGRETSRRRSEVREHGEEHNSENRIRTERAARTCTRASERDVRKLREQIRRREQGMRTEESKGKGNRNRSDPDPTLAGALRPLLSGDGRSLVD
jgi:hypothetical protein